MRVSSSLSPKIIERKKFKLVNEVWNYEIRGGFEDVITNL